MDNMNMTDGGLMNVQACESAPQTGGNDMQERQKGNRFWRLGPISLLYALFYTFCLYHNASGITYPFFAGGTLCFFYYYTKKFAINSAAADSRFLAGAILIAGTLNCTTDSDVLIFFNKLLMYILLCVLLLQTWHTITGWSIATHVKAAAYMTGGTISRLFDPLTDYLAMRRLAQAEAALPDRSDRKRIAGAIAIGLGLAMPVALLIVALLGSADAVFFELVYDVLWFLLEGRFWQSMEDVFLICKVIFRIALVFAVVYAVFSYNTNPDCIKAVDTMAEKKRARWDSYIAVTINTIICVIYLIFSGIQIFGLFLGRLELPMGYTYASYAQRGFFQLVFVCLFNIFLVLCTLAHFNNTRILKTILTVICACTYIMAASSAFRMALYIKSYRLTFLRVFVLWALVMITIVMTGVTLCIYKPDFRLFRYVLVCMTVGWLCFSAAHPDYWIARYNISHSVDGETLDLDYLTDQLSLDALPAVTASEYAAGADFGSWSRRLNRHKEEQGGGMGFRYFNFSRAYAQKCYGRILYK